MNKTERDAFILENMGLVRMVANRYSGLVKNNPALDMDDLISAGTIGLIKACDDFDPSFGTKFSTYAVHVIHGTISRYLKNNIDLIRFPRQAKEDYWAIKGSGLLDEEPEIIAEKTNKSIKHVKKALEYPKYRNVKSLDYVIYEDEGSPITLGEQIGAEVDMDSDLELELLFNQFNERTRKIITLKMQGLTQTEIGKIIGVSQAQISRVLRKVRNEIA